MLKIVKQSVVLPASPKELYAMYLSRKAHGAIGGGKVVISARPGSTFNAFGGALRGRMLQTVPGKLNYWKPWRKYLAKR